MNRVVEHARQLGLSRVTAEYVPTAKNGMVKDFFQQFGFTRVEEGPKGDARWSLSTSAYQPWRTFMNMAEGN